MCSLATFTEKSTLQFEAKWPAPNGETEEQVTAYCWNRVTNVSTIGGPCYQNVFNSSITEATVLKCIQDVQVDKPA